MNLGTRPILFLAGLALGVAFLFAALQGTNLWEVVHIVREHAHWKMVPLFFAPYFIFFLLKSLRWRLLLEPYRRFPTLELLPLVLVGYAANILFPMQLGEVTRAYLAGRRFNTDAAPLLTSIALERVFDLLAVIVCFGIALAVLETEVPAIRFVANIVAAAALLGFAALAFYVWRTATVLAWADRVLQFVPARLRQWLRTQLEKGSRGLDALRQAHRLGMIAAVSFTMWVVMAFCCLIALRTVEIEVGPVAAMFTLFCSVVGLALPTSPGFIGTIQIAFVVALVPFGVDRAQALAASVYYNTLITVPALIVAAGILISGLVRSTLPK